MLASWVWKVFVCSELARLQKKAGGVGGGAQPPPCANTTLASWVWKVFVCSEASLPGFTEKRGGWGGAQPPPCANTMLASWVWKVFVCSETSLPSFKKKKRRGGGGGWGERSPAYVQTQCSHHGSGRDSYESRGGGGLGGRPPSIFKHNNRTMGLEGIRLQDSRFHKATKLEIKIKRK